MTPTPVASGRQPGTGNPLPGQVPSMRELRGRGRRARFLGRLAFWRR